MQTNRLITYLCSRSAYLLFSSMAVLVIALLSAKPPIAKPLTKINDAVCQVSRIIDGDSLTVTCEKQQYQLRLMHIDAPELAQKPWGKQAKQALASLTPATVSISFYGQDVYDRHLAIIYPAHKLDGESINLLMVKQGFGRVYQRYKPPAVYVTAMKVAKQQGNGIWQQAGLQQNPQRFRRLAH